VTGEPVGRRANAMGQQSWQSSLGLNPKEQETPKTPFLCRASTSFGHAVRCVFELPAENVENGCILNGKTLNRGLVNMSPRRQCGSGRDIAFVLRQGNPTQRNLLIPPSSVGWSTENANDSAFKLITKGCGRDKRNKALRQEYSSNGLVNHPFLEEKWSSRPLPSIQGEVDRILLSAAFGRGIPPSLATFNLAVKES